MNDFLIYNYIKIALLIVGGVLTLLALLLYKKQFKKGAVILVPLGVLSIVVLWIGYINELKTLEAGYTFIDKHLINAEFDGYFNEYLDQMTDFTYGHINEHERLVSLVVGENFVFTVDEAFNAGKPFQLLSQKGDITISLDEALEIIREEEDYIVTDVKYLFEEHLRLPYYQFRVKGDRNLMLTVNAIDGKLQSMYIGEKGVK